jgi:hypothetical protein
MSSTLVGRRPLQECWELVERLLVDCPHSLVVERSCLQKINLLASFAASRHGSNLSLI